MDDMHSYTESLSTTDSYPAHSKTKWRSAEELRKSGDSIADDASRTSGRKSNRGKDNRKEKSIKSSQVIH